MDFVLKETSISDKLYFKNFFVKTLWNVLQEIPQTSFIFCFQGSISEATLNRIAVDNDSSFINPSGQLYFRGVLSYKK